MLFTVRANRSKRVVTEEKIQKKVFENSSYKRKFAAKMKLNQAERDVGSSMWHE
ncbi:hypothetical protein [Caproicibacterium amylolyticum]|uniref:Uncharacterized protein n=1 Tax=Caproicibacterium amylolyticum TaxID=2766537 RepID=A0A7G9WJX9_9FIRM|nr:hypothetical protein [Caproicibacterium amylolyticum]QNO18991.1 hypothetical protein H6X83_05035 [Caproicibacterium amylolyticum]